MSLLHESQTSFDIAIAGGGIVGAACALACAKRGLQVALVERDTFGSGATAAGMGHVVVMDDSEAQFALTQYSQQLWHELASTLPSSAEYEQRGTLWIAADQEEMREAERKHAWLSDRSVPSHLMTSAELLRVEPNLASGLAGALLVPGDAVVYPPVVALHLARQAEKLGAKLFPGKTVMRIGNGCLWFEDESQQTTELRADRIINALGAESVRLSPTLPIRKRKGHLVITDRYPGYVHHQLVELGYLKSAHSSTADSVAFNVQPRSTGQLLIGSSRQFDAIDASVDQTILDAMLARTMVYLPGLKRLSAIRVWTGFRAATPDKLPLIGSLPDDSSIMLATGHEGLGITTSLATAEILADMLVNRQTAIQHEPYLPVRYSQQIRNETNKEKEII